MAVQQAAQAHAIGKAQVKTLALFLDQQVLTHAVTVAARRCQQRPALHAVPGGNAGPLQDGWRDVGGLAET